LGLAGIDNRNIEFENLFKDNLKLEDVLVKVGLIELRAMEAKLAMKHSKFQ